MDLQTYKASWSRAGGWIAAGFLLLAGAAGAQPPCGTPPCGGPPVPPTAVITVDCDAGDSVQDALTTPAAELTVEIRGICDEDVVVARDDVVLSGRSPALDGLRGVSPSPDFPNAVLRIVASERVRVENLSIADGFRNGIQINENSTQVTIDGCEVTGTGRDGIQATGDSSPIAILDTIVTDHVRSAVAGFDADFVECVRCTLDGDSFGLLSVVGARLIVRDSTVAGGSFAALAGDGGATISITDTVLASDVWGPAAVDTGQVFVAGGSYSGSLLAERNGFLGLSGTTHTANARGFNFLGTSASASVSASTVLGFTIVEDFAAFTLRDGSTLDGDLICPLAGDAYCDDAAVQVTGGSSCEHCVAALAAPAIGKRTRSTTRPTAPILPLLVP